MICGGTAAEPSPDGRTIDERIDGSRFYGIGAAKTGTHSLAQLLEPVARSAHEPLLLEMVDYAARFPDMAPNTAAVRRYLRSRDMWLYLEVEVSHVVGFFVAPLAELFPESRFLVTYREPLPWLESILDDQLRMIQAKAGQWMPVYEVCFGRYAGPYPSVEKALAAAGLYNLEAYIRYWRLHYEHVLAVVPPDRRLLIATTSISDRLPDIERFVGLPAGSLDADRSHAYRAPERFDLLAKVDRDHVLQLVETQCGDLQDRFRYADL